MHGVNTNNVTESSFRVFKDVTLNRNKCFNVCELMIELMNDDASYYKDKLTHVGNNRLSQFKCNDKYKTKEVKIPQNKIVQITESVFEVESQKDQNIIYLKKSQSKSK